MIISNKARCSYCVEIIESKHRHDYKECKCGKLAVDGGTYYLKRSGDYPNCEELSEFTVGFRELIGVCNEYCNLDISAKNIIGNALDCKFENLRDEQIQSFFSYLLYFANCTGQKYLEEVCEKVIIKKL